MKAHRKKVMVTGGAGFLGSHLCGRLLRDGHQVLCVDNLYTGSRSNISGLMSDPHFELVVHDICLPLDAEADEIYNLACLASPVYYQLYPVQTIKTSVIGSMNMLELARRLNAKVFLSSTSEVYGDPLVHPQPESYWGNVNSIGPRACYNESKRCAETLFFTYNRQYKLKIKVARIFNTFGSNMQPDDGRVISNFIMQALKNEPLTVYGSGRQTRSFCYADDIIEGIVKLMDSPDDFTGPVNMGNPDEMSILELARKIIKLTGSASEITSKEPAPDDPQKRRPDITLAKNALGWEPKTPVEEGLKKTIDYFRALTGIK